MVVVVVVVVVVGSSSKERMPSHGRSKGKMKHRSQQMVRDGGRKGTGREKGE